MVYMIESEKKKEEKGIDWTDCDGLRKSRTINEDDLTINFAGRRKWMTEMSDSWT